jgi:hypothetical protein
MSGEDTVTVEMMGDAFPLWRCLHGGPLSLRTIDRWPADSPLPWERYRERNLRLIKKLNTVYGACAVVARHGEEIVGQLRFYPKAVWQFTGAGFLCLQQDFPSGPHDDFPMVNFLPREELADQTLKVHCLMTGSSQQPSNPYQRRGIGSCLVHKLVEWARDTGWTAVEAEAFEDLPIVYEITGGAGHIFWEKQGFRVVSRYENPYLHDYPEFQAVLEKQADVAGIARERVKDLNLMRLVLK